MPIISLTKRLPNIPKLFNGIPPEDFAYKDGNAFAVCDGVTLLHYNPYPKPSPAAKAARIAATTLVASLLTRQFQGVRSIRQAFVKANSAIRAYNRRIGLMPRTVDFLTKQYAATVCAFGRIYQGKLYWGQLNDCGVMIIDTKGNIVKNKLLDRGPVDAYMKFLCRTYGFSSLSPEEHQYFRREVVNNTRLSFQGKRIRWGVMTGETRAVTFLQAGSVRLKPGWNVVFYTDGMIPLLGLRSFRQLIALHDSQRELVAFMKKKEKDGRLFQSERTMVIVSVDGRG
ncbi:MAG: hypothetical protein PHY34_03245 [Patescibacteria group bacterium]|nr:hypothetical protein [Patescibacteria group bacterium]MDD5716110.1 hypothetical protein [Patescibacteria group bacterium]